MGWSTSNLSAAGVDALTNGTFLRCRQRRDVLCC